MSHETIPPAPADDVLAQEEQEHVFGPSLEELKRRYLYAVDLRECALLKRELALRMGSPWIPSSPEGRSENEIALDDIVEVGRGKPLGYLAFDPREQTLCGYEIGALMKYFCERRLGVLIEYKGPSSQRARFVVWDPVQLQELLDSNQQLLQDVDWPVEVSAFVHRVQNDHSNRPGTPMHRLISTAYMDFANM